MPAYPRVFASSGSNTGHFIPLLVNNYWIGHIIDRGEDMDEANGSTMGN